MLPNLRGRVEVTQIDRRGWNFAPAARIGSRLETRDITRGDRVPFPRGTAVVVTTAPLRVERGASPSVSVHEAIRRTSASARRGADRAERGLTSILRRDRVLDAAGQEELRRVARPSREFGGRAAPADPGRADAESWRDAGARTPGAAAGRYARERATATRAGAVDAVLPVPVEPAAESPSARATRAGAPRAALIDRSGERPAARGATRPLADPPPPGREAPARSEPASGVVPGARTLRSGFLGAARARAGPGSPPPLAAPAQAPGRGRARRTRAHPPGASTIAEWGYRRGVESPPRPASST